MHYLEIFPKNFSILVSYIKNNSHSNNDFYNDYYNCNYEYHIYLRAFLWIYKFNSEFFKFFKISYA